MAHMQGFEMVCETGFLINIVRQTWSHLHCTPACLLALCLLAEDCILCKHTPILAIMRLA